MGILLVYDVTDEKSFNSTLHSHAGILPPREAMICKTVAGVSELTQQFEQTSGPGSQTWSNTQPKA